MKKLWAFEAARHANQTFAADGGAALQMFAVFLQMEVAFQAVKAFRSEGTNRAAFHAEQTAAVFLVKAEFFFAWLDRKSVV